MKSIIAGILCFISLQCISQEFKKIKGFPEEIQLSGTTINKDYILGSSRLFLINESTVLFYSVYNKERVFYFINLDDFRIVNSCGIIGKGPGEIIGAGYVTIDENENNIWISDGMRSVLFKFPIDKAISIKDYKPESSIGYRGFGQLLLYFEIENDKITMHTGQTGKFIYNKVDGVKRTGVGLSHLYIKEDLFRNTGINLTYFKRHPQKPELIAFAYYSDDVLLIMKENGEEIKRVKGPDFIKPVKELSKDGWPKSAFHSIKVDENYIYCLYNGEDMGYKDEYGTYILNDPTMIFVYDWQGNPIKKINLEYGAYSFELDKKRNRIITFSNDLEEEIVYYDYNF